MKVKHVSLNVKAFVRLKNGFQKCQKKIRLNDKFVLVNRIGKLFTDTPYKSITHTYTFSTLNRHMDIM